MDISLIVTLKCLKFAIHVVNTHFEGVMSLNYDIGLSFGFIVCRRWGLAKEIEQLQTIFYYDLNINMCPMLPRYESFSSNMFRSWCMQVGELNVQKIKVKTSV